ncbi:ABC transporter permease [Actinophytocola sp.]|uniref:ABC transporter permease n=1 Tax=Actinophytocola sp. TaxID=1872138 RepID=UPI003899A5DE
MAHTPSPARAASRRLLSQLLFVAAVIAIWALVRAANVMTEDALPGPVATLKAIVANLSDGEYWTAIADTLRSALGGLLAAIVVGVPIGLVTGTYALAERSSRLVVEFGRSFPVIAILPVMLLVMGSSLEMKGVVVFVACVFPLIIQAQYGAASVGEAVNETVRSYRIPRLLRFRRVVLPCAAPSVMTGIRLASAVSVLVAVGVEILTTVPGMGHMVVQSQLDENSANAFAYIFTAGAVGFTINRIAQLVEARVLAWRPPPNAGDE